MLTRIGYVFGDGLSRDEFIAHPESGLANFFKTYFENHQEYRVYFNGLKESMIGGGMEQVLKPREYFRAKAKGEIGPGGKPKPADGDGGIDGFSR